MKAQSEERMSSISADKLAEEEPKFAPHTFLEEICPLLAEYFVGEFCLERDCIALSFKNKQKMRLLVCEWNKSYAACGKSPAGGFL